MWIEPKTNWVASDTISSSDFNRITGNLAHLKRLSLIVYKNTNNNTLPDNQNKSDYPFASKLNAIEQMLEKININTYDFSIGDTKTYVANGHPFDYNELNRIESATLKLYLTLKSEDELKRHLWFILGNTRMFDVPRSTRRPFNKHLGFRLGQDKTFDVPRK